jgi:asparagine N-glycosylation enzyme membrane subunit Stt3
VPVRGRVLGPECLEAAIGPDPSLPEIPQRDPGDRARIATAVCFTAAVVATALPWSRFGAGSGAFGAWSDTPAWSMLAAIAAVAGLALSLAGLFTRRGPAIRDTLATLLGVAVVAACILALVRPRPFASPWLGPWVALGAAAGATAAAIVARKQARRRNRVHI